MVHGWESASGTLWDVGKNIRGQKSDAGSRPHAKLAAGDLPRQSEAGPRTEIDLCTPESLAFSATPIGRSVLQGERLSPRILRRKARHPTPRIIERCA